MRGGEKGHHSRRFSPHFSPGFVARSVRCCAQWVLRPEGRGGWDLGHSPKGGHANSVGLRRSLRGLVRSLAPLRGLRLSAFGSEVSTPR